MKRRTAIFLGVLFVFFVLFLGLPNSQYGKKRLFLKTLERLQDTQSVDNSIDSLRINVRKAHFLYDKAEFRVSREEISNSFFQAEIVVIDSLSKKNTSMFPSSYEPEIVIVRSHNYWFYSVVRIKILAGYESFDLEVKSIWLLWDWLVLSDRITGIA